MAHHSNTRDHVLSFLPEKTLAKKRQHWPLVFKYERQDGRWPMEDRLGKVLAGGNWHAQGSDSVDICNNKAYFDGILVCARAASPVTAIHHGRPELSVAYDETLTTMLHVDHVNGPKHAKQQLRSAAQYINRHDILRETELVLGVTHQLLGNIAVRQGFQRLEIKEIDDEYRKQLEFAQRAVNAIRGIDPSSHAAQLQPAAVCMPTPEFIERFAEIS